ncbi:MAG: hypothetical protein AABY22_36775 [Nanoarchaeota archaeon]
MKIEDLQIFSIQSRYKGLYWSVDLFFMILTFLGNLGLWGLVFYILTKAIKLGLN